MLSYTPRTEYETDSYSIFDLSFNWGITERFTLRGGITNLLDEEPVAVASETGYPVGTNLNAVCGGAPGCVAPTGLAAPETGLYNGGYYDTIGRRYFMGFQVNF
jgi:outer membrane receptor protein involved in Fe transport